MTMFEPAFKSENGEFPEELMDHLLHKAETAGLDACNRLWLQRRLYDVWRRNEPYGIYEQIIAVKLSCNSNVRNCLRLKDEHQSIKRLGWSQWAE